MDNFEKLGFEVEVGGKSYTTALSRLDKIISRLDKINKLQSGEKFNKKGFEHFSKTGELTKADTKSAKRSGNVSVYKELQKQIAKEIELNHIWKQQVETLTQLNLAKQKKLTYDLLANNEDIKSANVQAEISKIMAKTAIDTGVLAKEEGKLALAKQATAQYDKQSITNMARLQAEQKALNDGKWEEARRIELANQQRKKEIDQRLKQELGIKQTKKTLIAYLAKLSSGVVIARRLGRFVSGAIQESANYVENLNLFAVAYGDVYQDTLKWALDLADGFGLASNEVLKFAGTFRQLSTSLGLVEDTANSVSQTVTQLGYDISALFNTSVENAMEKLQSGLFSGNVRPLRAYGIDISQNQIDALFETNETLAQLGVNARNLSQSDKVLARLIITLRDGSNAFGTMNREINTLQSQIRILQGSFSNFKLAIGDLVQEPIRVTLTYLNAFIISMTSVIRAFHPLQTEDENAFTGVAMGAEEATEAIDELNGKLSDFDKFNVLGGQSQGGGNLAVTEALTAELKKQQEIYQAQIDAMSKIKNEAVEMSKGIVGWFIEVDKEGNIVLKDDMPIWTENAKALGAVIGAFALILSTKGVISVGKFVGSLFTLKNGLTLVNTTLVGGILYSVIKAIEAFDKGEYATGALAIAIGTILAGAFIALQIAQRKASFSQKAYTKALTEHTVALQQNTAALTQNATQMNASSNSMLNAAKSNKSLGLSFNNVSFAIMAMISAYSLADSIINSFDGEARKTAGGVMVLVGAIMAVTAAIVAMNTAISWGTALPALLAGVGVAIAGVKGLTSDVESIAGFADGGYTNANLIMTHENGKREWVGKAAGSSAIVNDTQMSDIMEVAVAKGVYNALSARSAMGGNVPTNETIVVKIGEEAVFNAVRKTARRQGRDFANV